MSDKNFIFRRQLQEMNLDILCRHGGFQFTDSFFPYTSGEIGNYFVNSEVVQKSADSYNRATSSLKWLIENYSRLNGSEIGIIAGGETRDWIFSMPVANKLNRLHTMLYKDGRVLGADLRDSRVTLVSDLNNEGSSVKNNWFPIIKKENGYIKNVFFYVDRCEDGARVVKDLGLVSNSVVTLDEQAWSYLLDIGVVTEDIYSSILNRLENKSVWAEKMLKSDKGISRFMELFNKDSRTRERMLKVLDTYSDIKPELVDRLKKRGLTVD